MIRAAATIGIICAIATWGLPPAPPVDRAAVRAKAKADVAIKMALPDVRIPQETPPRSGYEYVLDKAFGGCGNPCVIHGNAGGNVITFALAAKALLDGARRRFIINGPCASACALVADWVSPITCITTNARFGFHMTSDEREPPHGEDILKYVRAHGGFPSAASERLTWVYYGAAKQFWRTCALDDWRPVE